MPFVFVSHAFEDAAAASALCADLESRGLTCWIAPRDQRAGVPYAAQIAEAVQKCTTLVVLLSRQACGARGVVGELELAQRYGKTVIPLRLEPIVPNGPVELYVRSLHWMDLFGTDARLTVERIRQEAERIAGLPPHRTARSSGEAMRIRRLFPGKWFGRIAALAAAMLLLHAVFDTWRNGIHSWQIGDVAILSGLPAAVLLLHALREMQAAKSARQARLLAIAPARVPEYYFRTGPYADNPTDRREFRRADNAHQHALDWIGQSSEDLLFLTGDSGCGKSSLLNAFVVPALREKDWYVVQWRGGSLPAASLIENTFQRIGRILVVVDQLEELLIERRPDMLERFQALLDRVKRSAGVRVLLVLRTDYIPALDAPALPALVHGQNWMQVSRFSFAAASRFLRDSGLGLSDEAIERLVRSSAKMDRSVGMVRPITLNLVGYTLARASSRVPSLDAAYLIRRHIAQAVSQDAVRLYAIPVLEQLVSKDATKVARTQTELAAHAALLPAEIRIALNALAMEGIVRPLDASAASWEISHDFLAHAVFRLIRRRRFNPLRYAAIVAIPLLLASAVAATLLVCIDCPAAYTLPTVGARPLGIAAGSDGNIWISEFAANAIARVTPSGRITEFTIPTAQANVPMLALGPDGALWFTENGANKIGRIDTRGRISEFPTPTRNSGPQNIVAGPEGDLWYTEYAGAVGKITPGGMQHEYRLPPGSDASSIAAGPDGMLWFVDPLHNTITRMSPAGKILAVFPGPRAGPVRSLAAGPDGAIWFAAPGRGDIGRITASGTMRVFRLPASGNVLSLIGASGTLWALTPHEVDRLEVSGNVIGRYPLRMPVSDSGRLAQGPDGGIWFTDSATDQVVRLP